MLKFKIGICSALVALCLIAPVNAKINAKERAEKAMQGIASKDENFTYNCQGNDAKASCTAKELIIDSDISLRNVKLDYVIDDKNFNSMIDFDLYIKTDDIDAAASINSSWVEFFPKHVSCSSPSSLQGSLYRGQITCDVTSPSYTVQFKSAGSIESDRFADKDMATIVVELEEIFDNLDDAANMQKELQDYRIDPRELVITIKGKQLGDKIFNIMKKGDPTYTREQYVAAVNMGVAMVPVGLANAKTSESTTEQVTKAATALGDIATSKKQQATISLKRKSAVMLDLADLPSFIQQIDADPLVLLRYLDEYQISVVSR